MGIEREHLGQKIFDEVQTRRNFAKEEERIRLLLSDNRICLFTFHMVVRELNYLIIPIELNVTVPRDFWSDKFLYDALLPVIIISILTSAIILTGIGILRMAIKILKLIFCPLGNSESEF